MRSRIDTISDFESVCDSTRHDDMSIHAQYTAPVERFVHLASSELQERSRIPRSERPPSARGSARSCRASPSLFEEAPNELIGLRILAGLLDLPSRLLPLAGLLPSPALRHLLESSSARVAPADSLPVRLERDDGIARSKSHVDAELFRKRHLTSLLAVTSCAEPT